MLALPSSIHHETMSYVSARVSSVSSSHPYNNTRNGRSRRRRCSLSRPTGLRVALALLVYLLALPLSTNGFGLDRRKFPGIWKLVSSDLPFEQDIRSKLAGLIKNKPQEEILLRLNSDGTFKQCNEDYQEGKWISGRWNLEKVDNDDGTTYTLSLAMNRQYFGPPYDVLLQGKCEDVNNSPQGVHRIHGRVLCGKFGKPTNHEAFFDTPMDNPKSLGPFTLTQALATTQLEAPDKGDDQTQSPFSGEENQFQVTFLRNGAHRFALPMTAEFSRIGRRKYSFSFSIV